MFSVKLERGQYCLLWRLRIQCQNITGRAVFHLENQV